ncbi:MAG: nitronate monooxygenase, partial [Burkholderiales bacterium]
MNETLTNALCRQLGIRFPIFGLAHRVEVAAAISRAGGLGVYGAARDGPHELEEKLRLLRQLCPDHPVGVDLLLPTGLPEHN